MDKFKITGGTPLSGELPVSGAKKSALPALAACLLSDEPVTLHRIPQVKDIGTMEQLFACIDIRWGLRLQTASAGYAADRIELWTESFQAGGR